MPLANPIRGQVPLPRILGREQDLVLSYSANALVTLEDELELTVDAIGALLLSDGARVRDLRTVFWAGLQDHQPALTLEDAGLLMTELGFDRAGELVARAYVGAFPPPPATEDGAAAPGPRKRGAAGAGPRSSRRGAKSGSTPSSSGG